MNLFEKKIDNAAEFFKEWEYISDNVMGGVSTGKAEVLESNNSFFLRLRGNVSTENNGGFIQVRTFKEIVSDNFEGIKLKVRGNPSTYTSILEQVFFYYRGNIILVNFQLIENGNM